MAKKAYGRNLFAIDYASIDSTLSEANGPLLKRRDELMRGFDQLPTSLSTIAEIDRAQEYAKDIYSALNEAKRARLDDGRPFSEATKTVKSFFDRVESPLKALLRELTNRVTIAVKAQQRLAALEAANDEEAEDEEDDEAGMPPPIVSHQGTPIITTVPTTRKGTSTVPLVWTVEDFDRERLDLEELRPFLTDAAILVACKKHLESHGPHKLRGVTYDQVAATG